MNISIIHPTFENRPVPLPTTGWTAFRERHVGQWRLSITAEFEDGSEVHAPIDKVVLCQKMTETQILNVKRELLSRIAWLRWEGKTLIWWPLDGWRE